MTFLIFAQKRIMIKFSFFIKVQIRAFFRKKNMEIRAKTKILLVFFLLIFTTIFIIFNFFIIFEIQAKIEKSNIFYFYYKAIEKKMEVLKFRQKI